MKTPSLDSAKEVYDKQWSMIMEAIVQNDAKPLYIVNPVYFSMIESANLFPSEDLVEGPAFAEWLIKNSRRSRICIMIMQIKTTGTTFTDVGSIGMSVRLLKFRCVG